MQVQERCAVGCSQRYYRDNFRLAYNHGVIEEFAAANHLPAFRVKQFTLAYYQQLISSFSQLTTWPKSLREQLAREVQFSRLLPGTRQISVAGDTMKVLFGRLTGNQALEAVLMRHQDGRNTVCVSCMVGCPVSCSFCATGRMGFQAHLLGDEIVDQVLYFARLLKESGQSVTNVVFMGMGEPMLNLPAVLGAIATLTDPTKFGLSQRRLTVSTSGYPPQMRQLFASGYRGRLAISLHAPSQPLREQLMIVAKVHPLPAVLETADDYTALTNKRVSYEYLMIDGVNDQEEHARQLVRLFRRRLAHINLIPYNPIPGIGYRRSPREQVRRFAALVQAGGVPCSIRVAMGEDIAAACGQLAGRNAPVFL